MNGEVNGEWAGKEEKIGGAFKWVEPLSIHT